MKRGIAFFLSLIMIFFVTSCTECDNETTIISVTDTATPQSDADVTTDLAELETDTQAAATTESAAGVEFSATVLKKGDEIIGGIYTANGANESAIEASGRLTAAITGAVIKKTDGKASSADDANFKGLNSAIRVYGDAEVTITNCVIEAAAELATGVFAYQNAVIHISDSTVTVSGRGAGGIQVAGGGTLYGSNLTVTTESKAAIRSDRGGGLMVIDGGTYTSNGKDGCPVIYSTADITVKNSTGISTNSRAVIIEGKNSVKLENCSLSGNDQSSKEGSVLAAVMLFQSASGDAKEGTAIFDMKNCKLTSESGALFYCTNTSGIINLDSSELTLSKDGGLLIVSKGRWGKEGKNGGKCILNAENQAMSGDITVDSISSLTLDLKNSTLIGAIIGEGEVNLTIDVGSKWTLTGNSSISSLSGDTSGINTAGYTLLVDGIPFN